MYMCVHVCVCVYIYIHIYNIYIYIPNHARGDDSSFPASRNAHYLLNENALVHVYMYIIYIVIYVCMHIDMYVCI